MTTVYSYDQYGNTTRITNGAAISTSLQYDAQARPITVTLQDGTTVALGYNAVGQRTSYAVSKGGTTSLSEAFQYRDELLGQAVCQDRERLAAKRRLEMSSQHRHRSPVGLG